MSALTHDELRELLGAYALDAVDEHEVIEIREHLAGCPACAAEVDEHHEITAMLANSGGDAPAHLWERISAQLATATPGVARTTRDELAPRRAARSARGAAILRTRVLAAAAVLVVIAALAVQVVRLDNQVHGLQGASPDQQVAQAAQRALADDAAVRVAVDAPTSRTQLAQIAVLPSGAAFLVNDALPSLPADRTYQLWGLVGTRLISLGLLGAHPGAVSFDVGSRGLVTRFAITDERAGGVVRSTHPPVAESAA
jgi:anti-sigma factor RsiW